MGEKKPDDIMAECLLAGGKMLSKACRTCGSPLFEVKGERLCVVCRAEGKEKAKATGEGAPSPAAPATPGTTGVEGRPAIAGAGADTEEEKELRATIAALARRAREEADPERCLALMEAAREAAEALSLLHR